MKKISLASLAFACSFALLGQPAAAQTFTAALKTYTQKFGDTIIFSSQSGNYAVALTTVKGEEGGMLMYRFRPRCACWQLVGSGGGVVNNARDLESMFGFDTADATKLATKIKAFEATQK